MKINHLNLSVPDVTETAGFFVEYFGYRWTEQKGRESLAVLLAEDGASLVLSNFDHKTKPVYPKDFHIGFVQAGREPVDAVYQRLHEAGYAKSPPRNIHGSWGFYFQAPGDIQVEVSCPTDGSEVA